MPKQTGRRETERARNARVRTHPFMAAIMCTVSILGRVWRAFFVLSAASPASSSTSEIMYSSTLVM